MELVAGINYFTTTWFRDQSAKFIPGSKSPDMEIPVVTGDDQTRGGARRLK